MTVAVTLNVVVAVAAEADRASISSAAKKLTASNSLVGFILGPRRTRCDDLLVVATTVPTIVQRIAEGAGNVERREIVDERKGAGHPTCRIFGGTPKRRDFMG